MKTSTLKEEDVNLITDLTKRSAAFKTKNLVLERISRSIQTALENLQAKRSDFRRIS